ncbi:hypothetical protein AAFN60_19090 [Roseibacillus persicicus]
MAGQRILPIRDFRADVDNKKLVLFFVENVSGLMAQVGDLRSCECAEEDTVLDVLTMVAEKFEDAIPTFVSCFVARHIVGAEVDVAVVA